MKKIKLFIQITVIAIVSLISLLAHAQTDTYGIAYAVRDTAGTILPASTTVSLTSSNAAIPAVKGKNLAIQVTGQLTGAGTTATTVLLDYSLDNSVWVNYPSGISLTPAGTTQTSTITNIDTGAIRFFRVRSVQIGSANACTNLTIAYTQKLAF